MGTVSKGRRFGQWTVTGEEPLGGGGNGEVWAVAGADGRRGAIKVLYERPGDEGVYRLERFTDEIGFLIKHPDFPGILPLLDSQIFSDLSEPSWYVMPVATPIRDALGSDPAPAIVLAAVAEIAGTLEVLAAEGVAHRDIKPDNLFRLGDQWVVGDFGLVTYPEKDPRTEHGKRLGPTDYMAPEMREDADQAEPGPADVWALAKTLWALLTGLLPLPGTHRAADVAYSLQQRISFGFAPELDLLLERATRIEPGSRPTMGDMAREFRACLAPAPEASPSAGLAELGARAAALTAASRQNVGDTRDRRARVNAAWQELRQIVREAAETLAEQSTFDIHPQENGYHAVTLLERPSFTPYEAASSGWMLIPPGQRRARVHIVIEAAMIVLRENEPADISALLRVDRIIGDGSSHEVHEVWAQAYHDIPIASAQQAVVFGEIRAHFLQGFEETLREAISVLSAP